MSAVCPYLIPDEAEYHKCAIRRGLCAWFFDLFNPSTRIQVTIDPNGRVSGMVSEFNFPDVPRRPELTEADVPQLCPRGYTFQKITKMFNALQEANS